MTTKERWTLALRGGLVAKVVGTWTMRDMPCDLRLVRSKKTKGLTCVVADVASDEYEAIQWLYDVVRVTSCKVSRQPLK